MTTIRRAEPQRYELQGEVEQWVGHLASFVREHYGELHSESSEQFFSQEILHLRIRSVQGLLATAENEVGVEVVATPVTAAVGIMRKARPFEATGPTSDRPGRQQLGSKNRSLEERSRSNGVQNKESTLQLARTSFYECSLVVLWHQAFKKA